MLWGALLGTGISKVWSHCKVDGAKVCRTLSQAIAKTGFDLSDWDQELVGAIQHIYFADRVLPGPVKRQADETIFVGGHR